MSKITICYASSNLFAPMLAVSMMSVIEHSNVEDIISFYIIGEGLTTESTKKIRQIKSDHKDVHITFIDEEKVKLVLDKCFEEAGGKGRSYQMEGAPTYIGYTRLILPLLFSDDIDRVLFMGADTMVNGSLSELFCMDLGNYPIAMCYDTMNKYHKTRLNRSYDMKYHNDDVVLINLKKWSEQNCTSRIFKSLSENADRFNFLEQDAINCVLEGNIKLLAPKYNVMAPMLMYSHNAILKMYGMSLECYYNCVEYDEAKKNPVIYHFAGNALGRPWYRNSKHIMKKEYDRYYYMSPFAELSQAECKWKKEYAIQAWIFMYCPKSINDLMGIVMQKLFGYFFVRNQK